MLQTEHEFTLPLGFVDADGSLHRDGVMRLATGADEILPLADPRVQRNPAYLAVILLSRVITRLGALDTVTPRTIESLFAADVECLQHFYNTINRLDGGGEHVRCPECRHEFVPERERLGGSSDIPSTG
jgi:hypothetical protein